MKSKKHHKTARQDKISVSQKISYGTSAMATNLSVNSLANMSDMIYNIGLGINPALLGVVQGVPRIIDAVSDPIIGNLSDNTRTRFGRRIPYILFGGIVLGIVYVLLWMAPRSWTESFTFYYVLFICCLFYIAHTLVEVPRGALGYEMTNDYHERTRLFAYNSFIINVGALCIPWLYYFSNLDFFTDPVEGMRYIGMIVAGILIVSTTYTAIVCKEPKFKQAKHQKRIKLWESMVTTCKNKTFVWLLAIMILVTIGFYFVAGFANYIMIYYVYGGDHKAASVLMGWCGTLWSVLSLIGVFPMTWIATRIGKSKTMMLFLLLMAAGNSLKVVCYNQTYPYLALIPTASLAFGMLVLFSLVFSMIADICDEDELVTGQRREGSYQAVYGWWWKLGIAGGFFVKGILLNSTGFNEKLATQSDSTLFWLRFWEIVIPAVVCTGSALLLVKYPLNEERAYKVKSILEQRRKREGFNSHNEG